MLNISWSVRNFIDHYANEIDNNEWAKVYSALDYEAISTNNIGQFTSIINAAGIDPLKFLDFVPSSYLAYSSVETISIYHHIK